jgi:hypothetical protein
MNTKDLKLGQVIDIFEKDGRKLEVPVRGTVIAIETPSGNKRCLGWIDRPTNLPHGWNPWPITDGQANQIYASDILIDSIAAYRFGLWMYSQSKIGFELVQEYPNQKCDSCGISLPHIAMKTCISCKVLSELDQLG